MKPIENVAIVGFGSLGAMYAGCFGAAMGPERVFVVADTARTERYRAETATFNGEPIRVTYLTYDEAAERAAEEPFDVVLYAVKYGALPETIEQSAPLIGPDTAIISVLNGVTSEEVLAERFGWDRVLLCVAQQMDSRKVGATVTAGCVGVMALGVHDAEDAAQRVNLERVTEWLTAIDQPFITPDDIRHQLWGKLICNVGVNQACAVYDCCFSGIHAPGEAREAMIAAMRDYVNRLGKAAQYLLSLVNDILDMSKLQAGKVDLTSEPFDVNALVDNVCEMQRGPMADRGIRFELSRTVEHPWLQGDEVRLSQVLMNILSNAVKFTPEGGRISMKVHEAVYASGNEAVLTVSIADTGCGMTKEFAEHVFDAFTQERNRNSDSQKGTGLGMSISYLLVTQMGGSITVESEPGCGSCFTVIVTLPTVANGDELTPAQAPSLISSSAEGAEGVGGAERAEKVEGETAETARVAETVETVEAPGPPGAVRAVSSPSGAEAARAPVEILVAEDNELNADIISSILTEEGFSITVAENGEEAVRLFSESPAGHFAAILMDAQMPVMDGYEASRAIRDLKRADAKTVRIFACTASTFAEDRNRALASGMDDFLSKPLNVTVMLQKLEAVRKSGAS